MRGSSWTYAVTALAVLSVVVACAAPAAQPTSSLARPTAAPTAPPQPTSPPAVSTLATNTPTKISVSYSERVGSYLPLMLAKSQGIFKKHGLDPDIQLLTGATGMSALLSGQVQIAQIGGSEAVSAEASGSDLVFSGNLGPVSSYVFIVTPDVKTIDDLKGKQVGISSVGGTADVTTRASMHYYGLDPDKDITIVAMGSLQNRTAGLRNGAIQAAPANPPDSFLLQREGFQVLFTVADLGMPTAGATIVAQRAWINDHRDLFQAWNDSVVEAIALAKARPDLGVPVMKDFLQSDDDQLMQETYDFWINKVLMEPPSITPEQFADTLSALAVNNPKIKDVDVKSMIDTSLVQNAVDKGLASPPQ